MAPRPMVALVSLARWSLGREWGPERLAGASGDRGAGGAGGAAVAGGRGGGRGGGAGPRAKGVRGVRGAARWGAALVVSGAALGGVRGAPSSRAPTAAKRAASAAIAAPRVATGATTAPIAPNRAKVSDTDHWPVGSQKLIGLVLKAW